MSENLRFAQTFSTLGGSPLLTSLFGCFPVGLIQQPALTNYELNNNEKEKETKQKNKKNVYTQTEWTKWREVN